MSFKLCRRAELFATQMAPLENAMTAFCRNPPASYYPMADRMAQKYDARQFPFHWDPIERLFPGASVLEVGCGTAHLCRYVEAKGGLYAGLDHSEALLQDNRQRFPRARFVKIGSPLEGAFDVVASLCTIERVADPPAYLDLLWRYCRPVVMIAVICPEFVDGSGFVPSVFFGRTPRRFRDKVGTFDLADVCLHLIDWRICAPGWKRRLRASAPGAFWLNLRPRVLHGADYSIDADAIHLVRLSDLVWFFEQKNAEVVQTSTRTPDVSPEILRFYSCLLLRKSKT